MFDLLGIYAIKVRKIVELIENICIEEHYFGTCALNSLQQIPNNRPSSQSSKDNSDQDTLTLPSQN